MENGRNLLENIYALYVVSSYIVDADGEIMEQYGDYALEDAVALDKSLLERIRNSCRERRTAWVFWEKPKFFYCAFKIEDHLLICGPMCIAFLTEKEKLQYRKKHGIQAEGYSIPKVEKRKICSTLNLIRIMDGDLDCNWDEDGKLDEEQNEKEIHDYRYRKFHSSQEHVSYEIEKKWMEAVKTGNWEMVDKISLTTSPYDVGILAEDEQKQIESNTVVMITLLTRAAIEGGVDSVKAYENSDLLLQKLGKCRTVQQCNKVGEEAVGLFIGLVQNKQKVTSYDYVEQCKNYVSAHFQENIKVHTIAERIGLDESYLGRLFKESESITIKKYIQQEKMKIAANMLKYSDASIAEISDYLSFHSKSYFGKVFSETFHMTPYHYRKTYKSVNFK